MISNDVKLASKLEDSYAYGSGTVDKMDREDSARSEVDPTYNDQRRVHIPDDGPTRLVSIII
jgi:hypothetical protein